MCEPWTVRGRVSVHGAEALSGKVDGRVLKMIEAQDLGHEYGAKPQVDLHADQGHLRLVGRAQRYLAYADWLVDWLIQLVPALVVAARPR